MDLIIEIVYLLPTDHMRSLNIKKKHVERKKKLMKRLEMLENQDREYDPLLDASANKAESPADRPEMPVEDDFKSETDRRREANVERCTQAQAETLRQQ
eukprot:CAMPEP_0182595392 /NCGR_PEP_ID=MMETSP1324-20130603/82146_1 /TAXON_ID=236786 /ORGANISM="Florenciella sp., Strain RCC1587" /LENGTH=98 /DNA_ID=CAMNT_0024812989 /DNA_START=72 /DNA_END=365 /DNA_ORIENTATION=-